MKRFFIKDYYFLTLSSISIILIIVGFFAPPIGEISNSVIIAVGEIFAFTALGTLIKTLDQGYDAEVQHKDTSIKISKKE